MANRQYDYFRNYKRVDRPDGSYVESYGRNMDGTPAYVDIVQASPAAEGYPRHPNMYKESFPVMNAPSYMFSNAGYYAKNALDTLAAADRLDNPIRMSLMSQPGGFLAPRSSNMFVTPAQSAGSLMAQDPPVSWTPPFAYLFGGK